MNTDAQTLQKMVTTSIKLRPATRREWRTIAENAGYDGLSEFIRSCVDQHIRLGGPSKSDLQALTSAIMDSVVELRRVGNNINQLAKHANSTGYVQSLDDALSDLDTAIRAHIELANSARSTMTRRLGTPRKWSDKELGKVYRK